MSALASNFILHFLLNSMVESYPNRNITLKNCFVSMNRTPLADDTTFRTPHSLRSFGVQKSCVIGNRGSIHLIQNTFFRLYFLSRITLWTRSEETLIKIFCHFNKLKNFSRCICQPYVKSYCSNQLDSVICNIYACLLKADIVIFQSCCHSNDI